MSYKLYELTANKKNYGATRQASSIKYIVIHYTANATDTAKANANYFKNNVVTASAHYFVDDTSVYQSVPDLTVAYAVGGSKYSDCATTGGGSMFGTVKNANSISIELCSKNGAFTDATLENAKTLVKKIMSKYNIPAKNVYRHLDVNGKHCPNWKGWIGSDTSKWKAFKESLSETAEKTTTATATKNYATVNAESGLKMRDSTGVVLYTIGYKKKVEVVKKSAIVMSIAGTKYTMTKVKWNGDTGYVAQKYLSF